MTDEQINAALYGFCSNRPIDEWTSATGEWRTVTITEADYCQSLDAIHLAERRLPSGLMSDYVAKIAAIQSEEYELPMQVMTWAVVCAPANVRAEALLKVLGKWEEGE
jgi:hypothetical protein